MVFRHSQAPVTVGHNRVSHTAAHIRWALPLLLASLAWAAIPRVGGAQSIKPAAARPATRAAQPSPRDALLAMVGPRGEVEHEGADPAKPIVRVQLFELTDQKLAQVVATCPALQELLVYGLELEPAALARLKALPRLRALAIHYADVTPELTSAIAGLATLESVALNGDGLGIGPEGPRITAETLRPLARLPLLRDLDLQKLMLGEPRALAPLREFRLLRTLDLRSTGYVKDATLADLRGLTALRRLELQWTQATDAAMPDVATLAGLETLSLPTEVGDQGIAQLKTLARLQWLDASCPKLTDAGLATIGGLKALLELKLVRTKITDAGLSHVAGLTGLQSLSLAGDAITDAGLRRLGTLTDLRELNLRDAKVTPLGLAVIDRMPSLRSLVLYGTGVDDATLLRVRRLAGLEVLDLGLTGVSDAGLQHIKGLARLRELTVGQTRCSEAWVRTNVPNFPELRELGLYKIPLTDATLAQLSTLRKLERLDTSDTQVTDAGLEHLYKMRSLRNISVGGPRLSKAGIDRIYKAMPWASISYTLE